MAFNPYLKQQPRNSLFRCSSEGEKKIATEKPTREGKERIWGAIYTQFI
jgi:hypothetical protein